MSDKPEIDELSGVSTTGHEWDGIKELNNPLPRWWLTTFYATIAFAAVYTVLYPAWPGLHTATQGLFGWSSRGDLQKSVDAATSAHAGVEQKIASSDINAILADPKLKEFAVAAGGAMFKTYCTQCHGSGGQGSVGFPNLNSDRWMWGGKPEQIVATITHGVRDASDPNTHQSVMPAFGRDGILKPDQIDQVANYVLKLGDLKFDAAKADAGAKVYADNCAACHGDKGEGNVDVGAPPLRTHVWLYNGTYDGIVAQVNNPRLGVMPAWGTKLGLTKVKELAAYVISLGGAK